MSQDLQPSSRYRALHRQFFPTDGSPAIGVEAGGELPPEARTAYDRNKALMDNPKFVEWLVLQEEQARHELTTLDPNVTPEMTLRMSLARFQLSYSLVEKMVSDMELFERLMDECSKAALGQKEKV